MEAQNAALSLLISTKSDICNYHGQVGRRCSVVSFFSHSNISPVIHPKMSLFK